jgi:hypothetical protein
MNRRDFTVAGVGLLSSSLTLAASASLQGSLQRAWVSYPTLIRQNCPLWCWAASISMIFASHGHRVAQELIVRRTFGAQICVSSGNTSSIANDLSQTWVNSQGRQFDSTISAAYDYWNGINNLDNSLIVEQLTNDKPLLYCNEHHAMVLVSVDYYDTPYGTNIVSAGVLDPWPDGPGYHRLTSREIFPAHNSGQLTFLAAVEVS